MLARGGSFGHARQEECLCLTIHVPYSYIAHCFQHSDIYVYAQPFHSCQEKCVARWTQTHGKHFWIVWDLFWIFLDFLIYF